MSQRVAQSSYVAAVKSKRSILRATDIPVLTYPDVRQAVDWLCRAFGFSERVQNSENQRSQLRVGDGAVIPRRPARGMRRHLRA